mgnify:FL=1
MRIPKMIKSQVSGHLSRQLKNLRLERGLSIQEAAYITDFSVKSLIKYENGSKKWLQLPLISLLNIAQCYDKSLKIEFVDPPEIDIPPVTEPIELMLDQMIT